MSKWYLSPTGARIVGTAETVLVMYTIEGINDDGTPDYGDAADSTVYWETAEQKTNADGKPLYQDADGEEWTFDQLTLALDDDEG